MTIYSGTIGQHFIFNTSADLTGYSTLQALVKPPSGSVKTWELSLSGLSTAGVLIYDSVSGDLDIPGEYVAQVKVCMSDGDILFSDSVVFSVYSAYEVVE